jgi:glycosyltransferase involved in cell wall biosynthesis
MRITIVTPSLNRGAMLADALESVVAQNDQDVEHIVVDGGSTDMTAGVLSRFPNVKVLTEQDRNLYEALNKGVRAATGEIIGFLNTDDRLSAGALKLVRQMFSGRPSARIVAGAVDVVKVDDTSRVKRVRFDDPRFLRLRLQSIFSGVAFLNGCFFRRDTLLALNGFDERFGLIADKDLLLRAAARGLETAITRQVIYEYGCHEGSLTMNISRPSLAIAEESYEAASAGLDSPAEESVAAAYRAWHAWSAGYNVLANIRYGKWRRAGAVVSKSFATEKWWIIRFLPMVACHLAELRLRRGKSPDEKISTTAGHQAQPKGS